MPSDDFVDIIGKFAKFVQDERASAYREGHNQALVHIKDWIREQKCDPRHGDNIPDLLDEFLSQWAAITR